MLNFSTSWKFGQTSEIFECVVQELVHQNKIKSVVWGKYDSLHTALFVRRKQATVWKKTLILLKSSPSSFTHLRKLCMFLCVDRGSSEELLQEHGLWKGSSELASAWFHLICKTLYCCNALHVLSREQILLRESSFESRIKTNLSLRDKRDLVRQADTEQEKCWKHSPVLCRFSAQKKQNSLLHLTARELRRDTINKKWLWEYMYLKFH